MAVAKKKAPAKKAVAKKPTAKRGPKQVTEEHKAAMARGRKAAAAVGAYLEALESERPRRRRELTTDQLTDRLTEARAAVKSESGVQKLAAAQHVIDLERRILEAAIPATDLEALENDFVEWAPVYAKSKGVSYAAFRATGVPAAVLKRAGISRAR